MRKFFFIIKGGFFGAASRYAIKTAPAFVHGGDFPLNTLLINIVGSFLLAAVFAIATSRKPLANDIKLGVTTGFLGAFTTFSTLCKEASGLLRSGKLFYAILYISTSVTLGLAAAFAGIFLVRSILAKHKSLAPDKESPGE